MPPREPHDVLLALAQALQAEDMCHAHYCEQCNKRLHDAATEVAMAWADQKITYHHWEADDT